MWQDPIIEEVRQARDEHAKQFNYDVWAILEDLKRIERESGLEVVSFPPKPAISTKLGPRPAPGEPAKPQTTYKISAEPPALAFRDREADEHEPEDK